jgi:hypothetical protein
MKICTKCKIEKELTEFNKRKSNKDGLNNFCKICYNAINIKYVEKWNLNNKERKNDYSRKYQIEYRNKNKEKISEYTKNYNLLHKTHLNEIRRNKYKERIENDILYRLSEQSRCLIKGAFKRCNYNKTCRTYEILGCSYDEFKLYLESKFESWMTWDNYGLYNGELNFGWDIDHIEPLFPTGIIRTEEDIIRLNHYTNLQPLCSKINRYVKKNNYNK